MQASIPQASLSITNGQLRKEAESTYTVLSDLESAPPLQSGDLVEAEASLPTYDTDQLCVCVTPKGKGSAQSHTKISSRVSAITPVFQLPVWGFLTQCANTTLSSGLCEKMVWVGLVTA